MGKPFMSESKTIECILVERLANASAFFELYPGKSAIQELAEGVHTYLDKSEPKSILTEDDDSEDPILEIQD